MSSRERGADQAAHLAPHAAAVREIRARYLAVLREQAPIDRPWLFIGASRKLNPGDSALALGSIAAARALEVQVVRRTPGTRFRPDDVPPGAVVLIHGGGNMGGLYGGPHDLQVRALTTLRGHRIIQLPQSIEFADQRRRDELRWALAEHGDVVVLARDARSLDRGRATFDCPVELSPDAAFGLGPLPRATPDEAVRVLRRDDKERPDAHGPVDERARDWPQPGRLSLRRAQRDALAALDRVSGRATVGRLADRAAWTVWSGLAGSNVQVGLRESGRGQVLVTDRLHGHVLACLAGVPHVVVNDGYGKVEAMWRTWTHRVPGASFASTWDDVPVAVAAVPAGDGTSPEAPGPS